MKKMIFCLGLLLSATITFSQKQKINEKEEIVNLIKNGYFNGSFNDLDTKTMAKVFHPDLAIFTPEVGDTLGKYPIKEWIENIEKRKTNPNYKKNKDWVGKCVLVDITGDAAVVKVELREKGKLVYIDYILLSKFTSGWKIVAKIYNEFVSK
jgi:Putative lumazine-binding